jgi:predicted nucleotide-binding protein (sugar kinase/HSP70/actin superfamily)
VGEGANELQRTAWRALIAGDILRKCLLKTRPYEKNKGETDEVHEDALNLVCRAIEIQNIDHKTRLEKIVIALRQARDMFRAVPATYTKDKPLIGVVGEIFCRLNTFSNEELIRKIEEFGGEAWLSDIAEWVMYTNAEQRRILKMHGKTISKSMLGAKIKNHVQKKEEHILYEPFHEDFAGYDEPDDINEILENSYPYLPAQGCLGEMVLSVGKSIYMYEHGADGIVDISPFTCMNGIICESVYPSVSADCESIPIRNFYFDGTQQDLDRDVGIFMELVNNYRRKKQKPRVYPDYFN